MGIANWRTSQDRVHFAYLTALIADMCAFDIYCQPLVQVDGNGIVPVAEVVECQVDMLDMLDIALTVVQALPRILRCCHMEGEMPNHSSQDLDTWMGPVYMA